MIAIVIVSILMVALIAYFLWLVKSGNIKKDSFESGVTKATNIFNDTIKETFNVRNNIDHCPHCGSRNIKHYRKGYNYKVGFWGAIFGVRGAGYAGGFDANHTCCRCMNCGHDWETDYDYRLIKK